MQATIADYEVIEPGPGSRHLCRPPARLGIEDPVLVAAFTAPSGWADLADLLVRLAAVEEPALLRAIEAGPDQDRFYLATEAAPGGALDDPLEPLGPHGALSAVAAASRAAHALHEHGMAHGAIGAAAVLVTARGPVLALPPFDAPSGQAVRPGSRSDLAAADPEILRGEAPSRSSDIWSLGATLHDLLAARPLFPGIDEDAPVTAVQRLLFTRPQIDPTLPPPVKEIVGRCLEADPADRPATASELAIAIDDALTALESDGEIATGGAER